MAPEKLLKLPFPFFGLFLSDIRAKDLIVSIEKLLFKIEVEGALLGLKAPYYEHQKGEFCFCDAG